MLRNLIEKIRNIIAGDVPTSVLIKRGFKVGKNFDRQRGCIIDSRFCFLISIGDNVTLAARVYILAHDGSTRKLIGYTKIGNVTIGNNVFIGANTIILPNVNIGDNIVIGAGSVVSKNLNSNGVYTGNPAKYIMSIEEYTNKNKSKLAQARPFNEDYWIENSSEKMKKEMVDELKKGIGFQK